MKLGYYHRFYFCLQHMICTFVPVCGELHWSWIAPLRIFFIAYFNLDLLFINIERTSWLKNPDTRSLKEEKKGAWVLWTSEAVRTSSTGGRCSSVYCTDKLWWAYVTVGKGSNITKTRNNLSKQEKVMNYLPLFSLETWILIITFICLFVMSVSIIESFFLGTLTLLKNMSWRCVESLQVWKGDSWNIWKNGNSGL